MGSSLRKFASADQAVNYCLRNVNTSKEKIHILAKLRTEIYRIIKCKVQSDNDNYMLTDFNLYICVDGKITTCQIGNGGTLLFICIVGYRTVYEWIDGSEINGEGSSLKKVAAADLAVHDCCRNSDISEMKKKMLRTGILKIIRERMRSGNNEVLYNNLNLNICLDGKNIMYQIGNGGSLLNICIVENGMVYEWLE